MDSNSGIGLDGKLPWNFPSDMNNFKYNTSDHIVLMGRKTWESIPSKFRPLPKRRNVIISETMYWDKSDNVNENIEIYPSLNDAILSEFLKFPDIKQFIIGGTRLINEGLTNINCQTLILTKIKNDYKCDVHIDNDLLNTFIANSTIVDIKHIVDNDVELEIIEYKKK